MFEPWNASHTEVLETESGHSGRLLSGSELGAQSQREPNEVVVGGGDKRNWARAFQVRSYSFQELLGKTRALFINKVMAREYGVSDSNNPL